MFQFGCAIKTLSNLVIFYQILLINSQDSISFSPNSPLCTGEEVQMVCYVVPPPGTTFAFDTAQVSFNGSNPVSLADINGNSVVGLDLTRYSANTDGLGVTTSRPGIRLVITSYIPSDSNTLFGCHGTFPNTTESDALASGMPMRLANPPSPPTVTVSHTNCTYRRISWIAPLPASEKMIERYYVYRNNELLVVSTNTEYPDTEQLMVGMDYQYSVIAESCAGKSSGELGTNFTITAYTLDSITSVTYDNTDTVDISWTLNTGTLSIKLNYSLTLEYNYTQSNKIDSYSNTSTFSQLSDVTTRNVLLTVPSYTTNETVLFNITACLTITRQCNSSFGGLEVCKTNSTSYIPTITPPTTPVPITTIADVETTSSNSTTKPNTPADSPVIIIGVGAAGGGILIIIGVSGGGIAIAVALYKNNGKNGKKGNLSNEEGEQLEPIHLTQKPAELVYAELDLVASKTGGITQTVEDTHYMPVRETMERPYK